MVSNQPSARDWLSSARQLTTSLIACPKDYPLARFEARPETLCVRILMWMKEEVACAVEHPAVNYKVLLRRTYGKFIRMR
jgi:hypothetical protein